MSGVRERTGTLLAAHAVVASFLGGNVIRAGGLDVWGSDAGTLRWLPEAGYGYQALRTENAPKIERMSRMSTGLALLLIVQTLAWLVPLGVD